ncbi:MAG TPA: NAD(P)H-hydrate dehydratase, partial [Pyrinomonadaceae bacterium]
MQKVLTAAQMREVDRLTTERYGIPSIILMENAAHAVARVITERLGGSVKGKSILVLCGNGNNGGDGAAIARLLWKEGAQVAFLLFGQIDDSHGDARANFEILRHFEEDVLTSGGVFNKFLVHQDEEDLVPLLENILSSGDFEIVVDALFGTGLNRGMTGIFEDAVARLENHLPNIISVDLPSGLDADRGSLIGPTMSAAATVTFTSPKPANVLPPASALNGHLIVANIGSPNELIDEQPSQLFVAETHDTQRWLQSSRFSDDSYKNKRGHALIIAGSETYSGAAVLAGNSAIRSGVGLVTLACPAEAKTEIASRLLPEVILTTIGSPEFDELVPKANAIAVGPGLSATDPEIGALFRKIVEERTTPVILDAGALWFFNPPEGIPKQDADKSVRAPLILTPHEGEFMRLLGTDDKDAIKDRVQAVRDFATSNHVILALKGERVLIGHPDGRVVVNPTGNSGLGKAGNGDTLTGVIAGFCAQAAATDID